MWFLNSDLSEAHMTLDLCCINLFIWTLFSFIWQMPNEPRSTWTYFLNEKILCGTRYRTSQYIKYAVVIQIWEGNETLKHIRHQGNTGPFQCIWTEERLADKWGFWPLLKSLARCPISLVFCKVRIPKDCAHLICTVLFVLHG